MHSAVHTQAPGMHHNAQQFDSAGQHQWIIPPWWKTEQLLSLQPEVGMHVLRIFCDPLALAYALSLGHDNTSNIRHMSTITSKRKHEGLFWYRSYGNCEWADALLPRNCLAFFVCLRWNTATDMKRHV